jgi:hypothetical protein
MHCGELEVLGERGLPQVHCLQPSLRSSNGNDCPDVPCTMAVYLKTGTDAFTGHGLDGGP